MIFYYYLRNNMKSAPRGNKSPKYSVQYFKSHIKLPVTEFSNIGTWYSVGTFGT
jgi:hypothetical protein